jgi:hypothetical protein
VDCGGMIWKGFGFMAFFAGVKASSFCIDLSCAVYIQFAFRGVWSHLFYDHYGHFCRLNNNNTTTNNNNNNKLK